MIGYRSRHRKRVNQESEYFFTKTKYWSSSTVVCKFFLFHTRQIIKYLDYNTRLVTCVPQSPTWFRLRTSTFENSNMRANVSPIMVDLKCPTCISFAMFGDEKSITALFTGRIGAQVLIPLTSISCIFCNNVHHWYFAGINSSIDNTGIFYILKVSIKP